MVSVFVKYDLILLAVFVIFVAIFLYTHRKNLQKEGLLFLYRTQLGMKIIKYVGEKYQRTLKVLSYISITIGYILMISMLYLFGKLVYIYVAMPALVKAVKVPPIMPLVPYLPQATGLNLPPFYFIYWIVILAIVAIVHEFAHGIFAAREKIKIKSTGFGFFPFFLPIFLAAFVEIDEKKMAKKSNLSQRAILSAGTFTNLLTGIIFFIILGLFFMASFQPAGVSFDTYTYSAVNLSSIQAINNIHVSNPGYESIHTLLNETNLNKLTTYENQTYLISKAGFEKQKSATKYYILFDDAPAINSGLKGAIIEINSVKIDNLKKLSDELLKYAPGQEIEIKTKTTNETLTYKITLEANPEKPEQAMLGVGFYDTSKQGIMGRLASSISFFKKSNTYYEPKTNIAWFIYDLLWWLVLISFSVALINMLPLGIFDGGRFFYLTVLAITKNEKIAEKSFKYVTYFLLLLLLLIMVAWVFSFF